MERVPELEQFVLERMGRTKISAVSMAVVKNHQIVYERGFGLSNRELGISATPRTNYCIGSITKSFTCLAVMQLQERGLLSVNDPVDHYLPLTVKPFGETIRIHHLMSHTSGIPALAYLENTLRYHHGDSDRLLPIGSIEDMLSFVNGASDWVENRPGERFYYLNEGYILLAGIIEKLSCMKYRDYIREKVLLRLGMEKSYHHRELFKADEDAAIPYIVDKEGRFVAREYPWGQAEADGGLISNALDMSRYMMMYLRQGVGSGGPIVKPESIDAMASKIVRTPPEDVDTGEPASYYGFGLGTSDFFGHRLVGHNGAMYVATASMRMLPEYDCGAVVLVNGSGYAPVIMADFALALVSGKDPWDIPALKAEKVLDGLTGTYETYRGTANVTVRRKGDYLFIESQNKYASDSSALVPFDLASERPRFYSYGSGHRQAVEFQHRDGTVEMINDRYKYRRTGRLPS